MIGTCLQQRYTLHALLRRRHDCQTYLAWDNQRCAQVVIKVLPFSYGFDWDKLTRFEKETNFLKQLSHPAIPEYLDGFEINLSDFKGFAWVQAYIQAKSLAEHVQQGRTFSEADIRQIANDLLAVLIFLHERNPPVIHRDIKPSNVLLGDRSAHSSGKVYLIDFGAIQTRAYQAEGTITVAGTFGYGAPEQFRGEAIAASDLYGLGMTLVYLLTGVDPTHLPLRNGRVIFESSQISTHLGNWIKGLIQLEPQRRFKTARIALDALTQENFKLPQLSTSHQQPAYSKLLFSKTSQVLSFTMPPLGWSWKNILRLIFILFATMISSWFLLIPLVGWCFVYHIVCEAIRTARHVLVSAFGYSQLMVTPSEIVYVTRWGILKTREDRIEIANLSQLKWLLPQRVVRDDVEGGKITIDFAYALQIRAGNKSFDLNAPTRATKPAELDLHCFTLPELEWISAELSDWLDKPIEQ